MPPKKPTSKWMNKDMTAILCPFCDTEHGSDDKLGRHLVHYHWREIEFVTKRVRDLNAKTD